MTILLVEDDPGIAKGLQINLELEGYKVIHALDLFTAQKINDKETLSLIMLDLGLPDGSGLNFLKALRRSGSRLPVIILTAQTDEDSVVEGLQSGANDYVKKPFSSRELLARVQSTLRIPLTVDDQLRFSDLVLLIEQRLLKCGETTIELNRREFDILKVFMSRPDAVVTRDFLLQSINKDGEIFDRTIDSHISHLRAKLKQHNIQSVKISSVYGVGYRLEKIQ